MGNYEELKSLHVDCANGVAWVTINNGDINLLDLTMFMELTKTAGQLAADDDVRVVVLASANPDFFIAHFDVTLIQQLPRHAGIPNEPHSFHAMCELFRTMPKPTIAMIEGRVGGGGSELALSCDMRFAAIGKAIFNQPEVALGILPGGSGTVRLSRLAGRSRAMEIILGCDDVDAVTAQLYGWVNRALPAELIEPFVRRMATRIAGFPVHAVRAAKAAILRAEGDLTDHLIQESGAFNATLGHENTPALLQQFLDIGGQTFVGERQLGQLAGELGQPR